MLSAKTLLRSSIFVFSAANCLGVLGLRNMSRSVSTATHNVSTIKHEVLISPKNQQPTAAVVLTHGLGDTAFGWADTAIEISQHFPHVIFKLPTAPISPVTINGGMPMPSWYDIESLGGDRTLEKCAGIDKSKERIETIIDEFKSMEIPTNRIVLAGFSQGAALSLFTGLNYPETLAGIVAMSGYMPLPGAIKHNENSIKTPIRFYHGYDDEVVPFIMATDANDRAKGVYALNSHQFSLVCICGYKYSYCHVHFWNFFSPTLLFTNSLFSTL